MTTLSETEALRWFAQLGITESLPTRGRDVIVCCPYRGAWRVSRIRGNRYTMSTIDLSPQSEAV